MEVFYLKLLIVHVHNTSLSRGMKRMTPSSRRENRVSLQKEFLGVS